MTCLRSWILVNGELFYILFAFSILLQPWHLSLIKYPVFALALKSTTRIGGNSPAYLGILAQKRILKARIVIFIACD